MGNIWDLDAPVHPVNGRRARTSRRGRSPVQHRPGQESHEKTPEESFAQTGKVITEGIVGVTGIGITAAMGVGVIGALGGLKIVK